MLSGVKVSPKVALDTLMETMMGEPFPQTSGGRFEQNDLGRCVSFVLGKGWKLVVTAPWAVAADFAVTRVSIVHSIDIDRPLPNGLETADWKPLAGGYGFSTRISSPFQRLVNQVFSLLPMFGSSASEIEFQAPWLNIAPLEEALVLNSDMFESKYPSDTYARAQLLQAVINQRPLGPQIQPISKEEYLPAEARYLKWRRFEVDLRMTGLAATEHKRADGKIMADGTIKINHFIRGEIEEVDRVKEIA